MAELDDGRLYVAVGASRSGKTAWVLSKIKGRKRLMVWDVEGQYPANVRVSSVRELARVVLDIQGGPGVIAYTGPLRDFPGFCEVAFEWVKAGRAAGNRSGIVFEETADVTTPAKAPDAFGVLIRRGLKYACDIFAITQRPAESDKTTFGNAGLIHCCRVASPRDVKAMANYLWVEPEDILRLRADRSQGLFDFIERDLEESTLVRGVMRIGKKGPIFSVLKPKNP